MHYLELLSHMDKESRFDKKEIKVMERIFE
jgi:hypothetical protein